MSDTPKGRTADEAIVQADAKYRIRTAVHVRRAGLAMTVYGGYTLFRMRTAVDRLFWGSVRVHTPGWRTFDLPWNAVVAIGLLVLGPLTSAAGYWLEARAVRRARSNAVTAEIFSQPKTFYD